MHDDEAYNDDPYSSAMADVKTAVEMALSNQGTMSAREYQNLQALQSTQMSLDPSLYVA